MEESDLRRLALLGAQARIRQLEAEAEAIFKVFPQLRGGARGLVSAGEGADITKPRRRFSSAGKKAISEGMRKYWARRKAKAKRARQVQGAS